jgi:hypothetical protein
MHYVLTLIALLLVEACGHPSWGVREPASELLAKLNVACDLRHVVDPASINHPQLEVRVRLRRAVAAYRRVRPPGGHWPRVEFTDMAWPRYESSLRDSINALNRFDERECGREELYRHDQERRSASKDFAQVLFERGLGRDEVLKLMADAVKCEREMGRIPVAPPPGVAP